METLKTCNKCNKQKRLHKFKNEKKKTCLKCEYRFKQRFLRSLVKDRKLTPAERISFRLGYMGTAFMMMSPHLLSYGSIGAVTYIIAGVLLTPQVLVLKQWNLVAVNINVAVGYIIYLMNFYGII